MLFLDPIGKKKKCHTHTQKPFSLVSFFFFPLFPFLPQRQASSSSSSSRSFQSPQHTDRHRHREKSSSLSLDLHCSSKTIDETTCAAVGLQYLHFWIVHHFFLSFPSIRSVVRSVSSATGRLLSSSAPFDFFKWNCRICNCTENYSQLVGLLFLHVNRFVVVSFHVYCSLCAALCLFHEILIM